MNSAGSSLTVDWSEGRSNSTTQIYLVNSEPQSTFGPRLLIIDNQGSIVNAKNYKEFRRAGYEIEVAGSTAKALVAVETLAPDLIILEAGIPQQGGFELAAFIRSLREIPVILVSDRNGLEDKLTGLSQGADDYLGNPYDLRELLMRVSVLLRRWMNRPSQGVIHIDQLTLDPLRRKAVLDGQPLDLGGREFDLLTYFVQNPHRMISRDELLNRVWHQPTPATTNIVQVCINSLRNKLQDEGKRLIRTVPRLGYSWGEVE